MKDINILEKEYNEIRDKYVKEKSTNLKEDLKNKLIEFDYIFNKNYENELDSKFPMTTTLDKEEIRLKGLIDYVMLNSSKQKDLLSNYKKVTGEVLELSYLKYSDNLKDFKERLDNVTKIVDIISDITNEKSDSKKKVLGNKLLKKEYMNLLYEFCLIDSLDIKEIDINKLLNKDSFSDKKEVKEVKEEKKEIKLKDLFKEEKKVKKEEIKEEVKREIKKEDKNINEEVNDDDNKILSSMPIIEKIGSVVPVNVFTSIEETEEKLPDVVLPTNGLKDDKNDIFIDTKDMFDEDEKDKKNK